MVPWFAAVLVSVFAAPAAASAPERVVSEVVDTVRSWLGTGGEEEPAVPRVPEPRSEAPWEVPGLSAEVLDLALKARACAIRSGERDDAPLTIIDYTVPSTEPRFWVLDLGAREVLFHERVAHGKDSGRLVASAFSNVKDSGKSSLGLFRAAEPYVGKHGRSLRLDGLDEGFNDAARHRAIVLHGADYVSDGTIRALGRLGRSLGCPALRREVTQPVIDAIRDGGLIFAYSPDPDWLARSAWLTCDG